MGVTYRLVADLTYLQTALARFRTQRPKRILRWLYGPMIMALLVGAWAYAAYIDSPWTFAVKFSAIGSIVGGLIGGLIGAIAGRVFTRRRLVRAARPDETITTKLDESGVALTGPQSTATIQWSAYERAVRFPDGIVLLQGRVMMRWLPDVGLVEGTPQQATDLVQSKVPLRTISG